MKTMTADQFRAHALSMGAEASIGGRPFNTARAVVPPKPITAAPPPVAAIAPPAPAPAPAPQVDTFTRADVEALLREQSDRFDRRLATMLAQREDDGMRPVGFTPVYGPDGEILDLGVRYERIQ